MNKCPRCFVARLDVRFYAMQVQPVKGPPQSQRKPLAHVSTPRMRNKRIVADISAPEGAAHDLVDIDHAHNLTRGSQNDETPVVSRFPQTANVTSIRLRRAGRWCPPSKENAAASGSVQESRL